MDDTKLVYTTGSGQVGQYNRQIRNTLNIDFDWLKYAATVALNPSQNLSQFYCLIEWQKILYHP